MAGKRPPRITGGGGKPAGGKPGVTPVGYGAKGHPFYNQQNYNKSPSGRLNNSAGRALMGGSGRPPTGAGSNPPPVAHNPGNQPVMTTKNPSAGQRAHYATAEAVKPAQTPKAPRGATPKSVVRK